MLRIPTLGQAGSRNAYYKMTEDKRYIDKAIGELLKPTVETTQQHIEVLDVLVENGQSEVARVNHSDGIVSVYFKVKNERFFLVVNLTKGENPEPSGTWVESGHRVYLTATSERYSYQQLSGLINLKPLTGWSKGDLRPGKASVYNFSRLSFEPNENEAYDLNEKLSALLTELEKDESSVINLALNSSACISVCRHQYISGNAGIHLDLATISRLQKLNLPLDIDTYISGNALKES